MTTNFPVARPAPFAYSQGANHCRALHKQSNLEVRKHYGNQCNANEAFDKRECCANRLRIARRIPAMRARRPGDARAAARRCARGGRSGAQACPAQTEPTRAFPNPTSAVKPPTAYARPRLRIADSRRTPGAGTGMLSAGAQRRQKPCEGMPAAA